MESGSSSRSTISKMRRRTVDITPLWETETNGIGVGIPTPLSMRESRTVSRFYPFLICIEKTAQKQNQPLQVQHPNNAELIRNLEKDDEENKMLLNKAETVDLTGGRFIDPRLMSSKQSTDLIGFYKCCGNCLMYACFPCNLICNGSTETIEQGQAGIMTSFGKYEKTLGPGFYYYNTCLYTIKKVNIKLQTLKFASNSLQTKDGLTIAIQGFLTYKCISPFKMVYAVKNIESVINDISGGLLKRLISRNNFRTILLKKKELSEDLR